MRRLYSARRNDWTANNRMKTPKAKTMASDSAVDSVCPKSSTLVTLNALGVPSWTTLPRAVAQRRHRVGHRVQLRDHLEPRRDVVDREHDAGQEHRRHDRQ